MRYRNAVSFGVLLMCLAGPAAAGVTVYNVTVNTSSIVGTAGSLDVNFNPGPFASQAATAQVSALAGTGAPSGNPALTGNATGSLATTVTLNNGAPLNDYFQTFTFGSTLSFTVTFSGPALTAPDGVSTSGSTFAFSMFSNAAGTTPALTTDTTRGFAFIINVNLDGTTTLTNYSNVSTVGQAGSNLFAQTISFAAIPDHLGGDQPFPVFATASSGLPVFFRIASGPATVNGNTVTVTGLGTVSVQAFQDGGGIYIPASAVQTFKVALGNPSITAVENAASFKSGPVAPASFATIFGVNLGSASTVGDDTVIQKLAGSSVALKDSGGNTLAANLSFASYNQINFVVPAGLAIGAGTVTVTNGVNGAVSFPITIAAVAPGVFTADSSGSGPPTAGLLSITASGSATTPVATCFFAFVCSPAPIQLPASGQAYLILYGTGIRGRSGTAGVKISIGGQAATAVYAGSQGNFPGLDQVNVLIPPTLQGAGAVDVTMTVDGIAANTVRVIFL